MTAPTLIRDKSPTADREKTADEYDALDMPHVYDAIHLLQETAWQVNKRVLEVALTVWAKAGEAPIAGLPQIDERPLPPRTPRMAEHLEAVRQAKVEHRVRPMPDEETDREILEWKRRASSVYKFNAKRISRSRAASSTILLAQQYAAYDRIYFPHMLDFRGRIYPIPSFLQPQGNDLARGLLTFADGLPITEENGGAGWLAIQLATSWGVDKVSFDERIRWVEENEVQWRLIAADPVATVDLWGNADKPFQALAAIFEWVDFLNAGWGFVSRLPVMVDGTCNGIQHLSAILRDPITASYVNLLPADKPQDIYKHVARELQAVLERIERAGGPQGELATYWLDLTTDPKTGARDIPRTLTKRQVMVLPYGGTKDSFFGYTRVWLDEADPLPDTATPEDRTLRSQRVVFLAGHLWGVVNTVVSSGMRVMKWLQDCAKAVAVAKPYNPAEVAKRLKKRFKSLADEKRPIVPINDNHKVATLKHLLAELKRANEGDKETGLAAAQKLYRFGGNGVRLSEDESGNRDMKELSQGVVTDVARKLLYIAALPDQNSVTETLIDEWLAKALISTEDLKLLPLSRFVKHPLFDRQGNLLVESGYDPATQCIIDLPGLDLSKVKKRYQDVEWKDVQKAVEQLDHAFGNVNWKSYHEDDEDNGKGSRAAYYALLIAPLIRAVLGDKHQPLFGIDKADPGMGGTLLAECAHVIWTGETPDYLMWSNNHNDEEFAKALLGVLKSVPSALIFDNVHGRVGGALIAMLATGSVLLRHLGKNEMFKGKLMVPTIFVGNGLAWTDENVRRVLPIRIDAPKMKVGDDGKETFNVEGELTDYLLERRSEYIGHLITIVQWWFKKECPRAARNVKSFEEFVSIMGGILGAAGIDGWLDGLDAFHAGAKKDQSEEIGILQALGALKLDTSFKVEDAVAVLFKELEGGSTYAGVRYETKFETLSSCVQNGAVGLLSLAKKLGYLKGKVREIEVDGETIKVKLTSHKVGGERMWKVLKVS